MTFSNDNTIFYSQGYSSICILRFERFLSVLSDPIDFIFKIYEMLWYDVSYHAESFITANVPTPVYNIYVCHYMYCMLFECTDMQILFDITNVRVFHEFFNEIVLVKRNTSTIAYKISDWKFFNWVRYASWNLNHVQFYNVHFVRYIHTFKVAFCEIDLLRITFFIP